MSDWNDLPAQALPADGLPAGLPADAVVLGRVHGAWGVRGWLRVAPFNDPHESVLLGQRQWWLRGQGGAGRALEIEAARAHGAEIVAKPVGVDDRDTAASFDGCEVLIARSAFPPAAGDEFYWVDLLGCIVRNPAGETLGVVTGVEDHTAHPLLRLADVDASGAPAPDRLIPLVPEYVLKIDLQERSILADWSPGY